MMEEYKDYTIKIYYPGSILELADKDYTIIFVTHKKTKLGAKIYYDGEPSEEILSHIVKEYVRVQEEKNDNNK